jgi:hypothetical protein
MSELEKVKKEFESYCCRLHDVHCVKKICKDCAIEFMYDREQKLKSEAVKIVEGTRIERYALTGEVFDDYDSGYYNAVDDSDKKIAAAIKKIEGL